MAILQWFFLNLIATDPSPLQTETLQFFHSLFHVHGGIIERTDVLSQTDLFVVVTLESVFDIQNLPTHLLLTLIKGCQSLAQNTNISLPHLSLSLQGSFSISAFILDGFFQALDLVIQLLKGGVECFC